MQDRGKHNGGGGSAGVPAPDRNRSGTAAGSTPITTPVSPAPGACWRRSSAPTPVRMPTTRPVLTTTRAEPEEPAGGAGPIGDLALLGRQIHRRLHGRHRRAHQPSHQADPLARFGRPPLRPRRPRPVRTGAEHREAVVGTAVTGRQSDRAAVGQHHLVLACVGRPQHMGGRRPDPRGDLQRVRDAAVLRAPAAHSHRHAPRAPPHGHVPVRVRRRGSRSLRTAGRPPRRPATPRCPGPAQGPVPRMFRPRRPEGERHRPGHRSPPVSQKSAAQHIRTADARPPRQQARRLPSGAPTTQQTSAGFGVGKAHVFPT